MTRSLRQHGWMALASDVAGFLWYVGLKFRHGRCLQSASSLTTTTLFALVPLVTLSITLFSFFPGFIKVKQSVQHFLVTNMLPDSAGRIISIYMTQFSGHASQLTYAGLALLMGTVFSLVITVDHTFNAIWGTAPKRPWPSRFMIYLALILLGPVFLGLGVWATSLLVSLSMGWVGEGSRVTHHVLKWLSAIVLAGGLALAYYKIPGHPVKGRHALFGGMLAALVFEFMKSGFTGFISHFSSYTLVYGAFAAFPIFLLWIQLSWAVVLFFAVLTASLPLWPERAWRSERQPGESAQD